MTRVQWCWANLGAGLAAYIMALALYAEAGAGAVIGCAITALLLGAFTNAIISEEAKHAA